MHKQKLTIDNFAIKKVKKLISKKNLITGFNSCAPFLIALIVKTASKILKIKIPKISQK